jgi:hypothetical protein
MEGIVVDIGLAVSFIVLTVAGGADGKVGPNVACAVVALVAMGRTWVRVEAGVTDSRAMALPLGGTL